MNNKNEVTYYNKKRKHYIGWFYDEIYRANIHIIWPVSQSQLNEYSKKQFDIEIDDQGDFGGRTVLLNKDDIVAIILAMPDLLKTPEWYSRLAHECLHLTSFVLEERNLYFNKDSDEAWAYYLESSMRRILEMMKYKKK